MRFIPRWLKVVMMTAALGTGTVWFGPSSAMGQDVAVGTASATVLATLSVTATSPLAFGTVYQGVAKVIPKNDANAGVFTLSGQATSQVTIYMQMPEYLQGPGNDRMVVAFGTTDIQIDTTANVNPATPGAGGYANRDPHNLPTVTLRALDGSAHVFLGGKVIPSVNQAAGAYSADIVVTVAYNGS
ncbi:MAG: DUF4402 domain-containing protein [Candidatus Zixiibacteriota bacterium]